MLKLNYDKVLDVAEKKIKKGHFWSQVPSNNYFEWKFKISKLHF